MITVESLAESYFKRLEVTDNPQLTLLQFYNDVFDLKTEKDDIVFISNLIKLYGKWHVFHAILGIGSKKNLLKMLTKPFVNGTIRNECSRMFYGAKKSQHPSKDMTDFVTEREKLSKEGIVLKEELDE